MPAAPQPLSRADLRRVQAVFTDVDGTLTTKGLFGSKVLAAIERLDAAGVKVVLVSGRPAGWGECWARQLPVAGVIVENGGLAFVMKQGRLERLYAQSAAVRRRNRPRLRQLVARAMKQVKGARLSSDSAYTEVDLAIDHAEDVSLGPKAAQALEDFLRAHGASAVRSSVHVNCWLGRFDKRSAVNQFLRQVWKTRLAEGEARYVYAGDSLNDAPMFDAFPLSVGVANVLDVLTLLDAPPKFVTRAREGQGFLELADAVLAQRRGSAR